MRIDPYNETPQTRAQRFSHYFSIIYCLAALIIGVNLRDSVLYATTPYTDREVGITANYPAGWLLSIPEGDVLYVEDMRRLGFKTTIRIQVLPFSPSTHIRNVIDSLALRRSAELPFYKTLTISSRPIRASEQATILQYTYVSSDNDPFLQKVPIVVQAEDVLIIRRNQVILISFAADATRYNADYPIFTRFLEALSY
jgi:hypothetical protein